MANTAVASALERFDNDALEAMSEGERTLLLLTAASADAPPPITPRAVPYDIF